MGCAIGYFGESHGTVGEEHAVNVHIAANVVFQVDPALVRITGAGDPFVVRGDDVAGKADVGRRGTEIERGRRLKSATRNAPLLVDFQHSERAVFFEKRQHEDAPADSFLVALLVQNRARGQFAMLGFIVQTAKHLLPQIAETLRPPTRLPRRLHRGQQEPDENRDDGDHH